MAFVLSLVLHLGGYGTYQVGKALGLWRSLQWKNMAEAITDLNDDPAATSDPNSAPPLLFVDVNPQTESKTAPEDTRFYSDKNSIAANVMTEETADLPLFDGSQEEMIRTDDVPPSKALPLQPLVEAVEEIVEEEPPEEVVEDSSPPQGDLLLARADDRAKEEPPPVEKPPRPRTLKEAMARLSPAEQERLAGRRMKMDGGVRRLSIVPSVDAAASPFGEYDRALILAIQNRWFDLLDMRGFSFQKSGRVVLEFRLHYDGRVSGLKVTENTVDEMLSLLCQRAVADPAPYAKWPSDMRRMVGANHRDVRFAFYYN